MRAKEFIIENGRGKPNSDFAAANPGLVGPVGMEKLYTSRYYDFYRISTLTGLSPEQLEKTDALSYLGNLPMYSAYTEEDHKKLVRALKKLGLDPKDYIPAHSKENNGVNKTSPIAKKKKNKFGV